MPETPPPLNLRDIPDVKPFLPTTHIWLWTAGGILLILAFIAWLLRKNRKAATAATPHLAYRQACNDLENADVSKISLILRRYLAAICGDPSIFETHEEFLARQESLQFIPDPFRLEIKKFLDSLASRKYTPMIPSDEENPMKNEARSLIDRIHTFSLTTPLSTQ